jgi:hypothetical protein
MARLIVTLLAAAAVAPFVQADYCVRLLAELHLFETLVNNGSAPPSHSLP